ncbi:MAG: cation transporter, partial [Amphiplicatus sp.]
IMATDWTRIDPILSLVVAALIGRSAMRLLRETSHILLEGAPQHIDVASLIDGVKGAAPNVVDVHDVYIWQLTPEHTRLTLHARIADTAAATATLDRIKSFLEQSYGITETTVQIEVGLDCPDEAEALEPLKQKLGGGHSHAHHAHPAFAGHK